MKATQKLLSLALALATVLALGVSAAAANETYSITIDGSNTAADHTFEAYQIFKGDLHIPTDETQNGTPSATQAKILSNIVWGAGVDQEKVVDGKTLSQAFDNKTAAVIANELTTTAEAEAFAKKVAPYLSSVHTDVSEKTNGKYVISGLSAGYYLVKDKDNSLSSTNDFYTAYMMKVVADVQATPKGEKPSLKKQIQNNNNGEWSTTGNVGFQLGDTVNFRLIASVPDTTRYTGGYTYTITDTMTEGLTSNVKSDDDVVIQINNNGDNILDKTYYTVTASQVQVNGKTVDRFTLSIDIKQAVADGKITAGNELYILYSAVLNDKADFYLIGKAKNSNTAYLEYSNDPNGTGTGKTTESTVNAWTFPAIISKVDGADTAKTLTGAKFVLSRNPNLKIADMQCDENGVPTVTTDLIALHTGGRAAYEIVTAEEIEAGTDITYVVEMGSTIIAGFGEHDYYLYETKAPAGYNLLAEPVKFTIHASETMDLSAGDPAWLTLNDSTNKITSMTFTIANNSGATLPETGGIGTTIFYAVGGLLVVGAGVLLVTRKRMSKSDH